MKLSVEEASDNFTRFSKRLKNEELRNLLKHTDERSQRITLNNYHYLDVVCMCATDELTDEFRYLYLSKLSCSICYIYEYEDRIFLDKEEITEYLCDIHDGDAEYLDLDDDEFEIAMHTEADKYFKQKAIVIYARSF